jgi:hypothetical protein
MKNKTDITQQRLFTVPGKPTPKHDEFLLIFKNDINCYNRFIYDIIKPFANEDVLIRVKPESKVNKYIDAENNNFYANQEEIYYYNDRFEPQEQIIVKKVYTPIFKLHKWIPESPILNNNYYFDSIDLLVDISIDYEVKMYQTNDEYWLLEPKTRPEEFVQLLFEFKPEILSFSEVIRQVKVYQQYFGDYYKFDCLKIKNKVIPIVVTYSDISKFKDIFESQGIKLIQLKEGDTSGREY